MLAFQAAVAFGKIIFEMDCNLLIFYIDVRLLTNLALPSLVRHFFTGYIQLVAVCFDKLGFALTRSSLFYPLHTIGGRLF